MSQFVKVYGRGVVLRDYNGAKGLNTRVPNTKCECTFSLSYVCVCVCVCLFFVWSFQACLAYTCNNKICTKITIEPAKFVGVNAYLCCS
jgi:hypothetical protein